MSKENEDPRQNGHSPNRDPADETDALVILRQIVGADPDLERLIQQERVNAEVAMLVYDVRTKAGLTQEALAQRVGVPPAAIEKLEEGDYPGHALSLFQCILQALNLRLAVRVPDEEGPADPLRAVFQRLVRWLREGRHLSVDELAEASSIKREDILALERSVEYRPSLLTIRRLALFFGLPQHGLAQLARAHKEIPEAVRQRAAQWVTRMERFSTATQEESALLEEVVWFLKKDAETPVPPSKGD